LATLTGQDLMADRAERHGVGTSARGQAAPPRSVWPPVPWSRLWSIRRRNAMQAQPKAISIISQKLKNWHHRNLWNIIKTNIKTSPKPWQELIWAAITH